MGMTGAIGLGFCFLFSLSVIVAVAHPLANRGSQSAIQTEVPPYDLIESREVVTPARTELQAIESKIIELSYLPRGWKFVPFGNTTTVDVHVKQRITLVFQGSLILPDGTWSGYKWTLGNPNSHVHLEPSTAVPYKIYKARSVSDLYLTTAAAFTSGNKRLTFRLVKKIGVDSNSHDVYDYGPETTITLRVFDVEEEAPRIPIKTMDDAQAALAVVKEGIRLLGIALQKLRLGSTICEGGPNYRGKEHATFTVKLKDQCRDLCAADPHCKVYTTVKLPAGGGYTCSIRLTINFRHETDIETLKHGNVENSCTDRSLRCFEDNMLYWGPNQVVERVSSVSECVTRCLAQSTCHVFTVAKAFPDGGAECTFSDFVVYKKPQEGLISGTTYCDPPTFTLAHYVQKLNGGSTICRGTPRYNKRELVTVSVYEKDHCRDLCAAESDCKVFFIEEELATGYKCVLRGVSEVDEDDIQALKHRDMRDVCFNRLFVHFIRGVRYTKGFKSVGRVLHLHQCYVKCWNQSYCNAFYIRRIDAIHNECFTSSTWQGAFEDAPNYMSGAMIGDRAMAMMKSSPTICEGDGNLYSGPEITQLTVKEKIHCRELCAEDSFCKIWSIIRALGGDRGFTCSLKRFSEAAIQTLVGVKTSTCSSRKFLCFERRQSPKIKGEFLDCYKECFRQDGCKAFYVERNGCHKLLTWPDGKPTRPGYVLGTMDCSESMTTVHSSSPTPLE